MRIELNQAEWPGGFGRVSDFLVRLLLSATIGMIGQPALASSVGGDSTTIVQQQPSAENRQPEEKHEAKSVKGAEPKAPPTAPDFCEALATAAAANELPVDIFT